MKIAVCPGSFDPVTKGHLDIIRRAAALFDRVVVLVAQNPNKHYVFTTKERCDLVQACIAEWPNVTVEVARGLLVDDVKRLGACAIVKGLRAVSDFEYEFQQALVNKKLYPDADTVFLTTSPENMFLSSSIVKQVAAFGGSIDDFVPEAIRPMLLNRLKQKN